MSIGKGIKLSTGFDLNAKAPLDNRTVFETLNEMNSLPNINLYDGLTCFVKETKENYQYIDGKWSKMTIDMSADKINIVDKNNKFNSTNVEDALDELSVKIDNSQGLDEVQLELINSIPSIRNDVSTLDSLKFDNVDTYIFGGNNVIDFYADGAIVKSITYKGNLPEIQYSRDEPIYDNIQLWIDPSTTDNVTSNIADSIIEEIRVALADLNSQIETLKKQNIALEQRVAYLEMFGGNNGGSDGDDGGFGTIYLTFEDGSKLTFEDGSEMTFED